MFVIFIYIYGNQNLVVKCIFYCLSYGYVKITCKNLHAVVKYQQKSQELLFMLPRYRNLHLLLVINAI